MLKESLTCIREAGMVLGHEAALCHPPMAHPGLGAARGTQGPLLKPENCLCLTILETHPTGTTGCTIHSFHTFPTQNPRRF